MDNEEHVPESTDVSEDNDRDEVINIPSRTPLPPPPDINFTRPTLNHGSSPTSRSLGIKPGQDRRAGDADQGGGSSTQANWGAGLGISVSFGASIIGGFWLGQWIDHHWNHGGILWGTLTMTLAGVAVGFYNVLRLTSSLGKSGKKK